MKSRIARVSVHQTSKTLALIYALIALIMMPFGIAFSLIEPVDESLPAILWLFFPFIYGALAYVAFALMIMIYNFIAKRWGGVEFQTESVDAPPVF